jgi:hypothetical protein
MTSLGRSVPALALALSAVLLVWVATVAADPTAAPTAQAELAAGDLRSEGAGPGLVGNPLLILGAVVVLGLATALATAVLLRLTRRA